MNRSLVLSANSWHWILISFIRSNFFFFLLFSSLRAIYIFALQRAEHFAAIAVFDVKEWIDKRGPWTIIVWTFAFLQKLILRISNFNTIIDISLKYKNCKNNLSASTKAIFEILKIISNLEKQNSKLLDHKILNEMIDIIVKTDVVNCWEWECIFPWFYWWWRRRLHFI